MTIRPSVRMYQRGFHFDGFPLNLILGSGMKICPDTPSLVKIGQKYQELHRNK
jgi:hypothetical protein